MGEVRILKDGSIVQKCGGCGREYTYTPEGGSRISPRRRYEIVVRLESEDYRCGNTSRTPECTKSNQQSGQ
ncbi:MAG: hypothetical protein A3F26_00265 [Candidatus Ryanbacteria bacterium RIFCSPHIGHO2_12_FULL_47_12b]|uniref:Uncharacterized protein n=1 Tax=Candidatus Ryanbacteria bacterium RIFCSPLOWO2_12_FULL_47_9c TaxID=1802131 RepID=A0A1G2H4B0_9BACT|nr:MAG: hypothetical protein A3C83_02695 [Candidatus Ryanbacteria bacterium RIFCSPHIGHO2_02_FULL_47_25]OGZ51839.1 MAG: hypothetical protein A3F26_00265 [Candidatus Ryanbacteria bacterium RIFCSPHIGHO2_12_FULL_47_12b]OGZ57303.1 MAG: hypothetical protein A3G60_01515 [Candidatus Ryanbacteria bacterium RIFCSPLOWO2_12_FULL_47_9c]